MSAKGSGKVPREVLEEIGLIAEIALESAAMDGTELPTSAEHALSSIRSLAFGVIEGMNPTPKADEISLDNWNDEVESEDALDHAVSLEDDDDGL